MITTLSRSLASGLREVARPLAGRPEDFDVLVALVGNARLILIGEASHGTHEFYRIRAEITKRLIRERAVTAVAVEADWPDAHRVNQFVRGRGNDADAEQALAGFRRFPQWMWRNADVLDFVGWLRAHNETRAESAQVGFYGIDLYSLHASMEAVLSYLRAVDPEAARRAALRHGHCGDDDPQEYGYASSIGLTPSCEAEVVSQLVELRRSAAATEMGSAGELNVGQLVRQRYGREAVLIGFTTHAGTVTAADDWGAPAQRKNVRPALPNSYEGLFHDVGVRNFYLDLNHASGAVAELNHPRLERAIGVIYRPETERLSHYFHAQLPAQFDAVLHYDTTRAVEPLERTGEWQRGELPETYPTAL